MEFAFHLPVNILFGGGCLDKLPEIIAQGGYARGVLVCDSFFRGNGMADEVIRLALGRLIDIFSDIRPNPTVENVDACADVLRRNKADFVVAMGGGSTLDCAKASAAIMKAGDSMRAYHTGGKALDPAHGIDVIAVPTTAGTGSEVTWVAVLTDEEQDIKAPIGNPMLLPKTALVDHRLTLDIPAPITAPTGIDVLAHALEGYWCVAHQPICDITAMEAARLVFAHLPDACRNGRDEAARERMSLASLFAGIAFGHPKTTGPHACSFPLTNRYNVPHGEACAFTLDSFCRINASRERERLDHLATYCGFADVHALADGIAALKRQIGLRTTLAQIGVTDNEIPELARLSMHPNMLNNPVPMTVQAVESMYRGLR